MQPNLRDNPRQLLHHAGGRIDARRPQLGGQQVAPAEDVERQIAVAVVVAVEEPSFLLAVHRIVGRIEVEDDLVRRLIVRLQEQLHEQLLDRDRIVADLVIARRLQPAQLEPVQRRFAGNRRTVFAPRLELACQHGHHRIVAQLVVVVDILIAECDAEHPLADQRRHLMLDQLLAALVVKAPRQSAHQSDRAICRPQQQSAGIRRDRTTVEASHNFPPLDGCKSKQIRATLCRHRGDLQIVRKSFSQSNFR